VKGEKVRKGRCPQVYVLKTKVLRPPVETTALCGLSPPSLHAAPWLPNRTLMPDAAFNRSEVGCAGQTERLEAMLRRLVLPSLSTKAR